MAILAILTHVLVRDVDSVTEGAAEAVAASATEEATVSLDQALRDVVQFLAVLLAGASIGMWVTIRWTRSLLTLPDPTVQPSTSLWAGALDLVVPGFVVGLPAGIWLNAFIERDTLMEADLPPNWLVAGCLVPFLVLLRSIPAHPSGQALHVLLCGTAVFRAQQGNDDAAEAGQRVWGPCW